MDQRTRESHSYTPPPPPDPGEVRDASEHREVRESAVDRRVSVDKRVWSPAQLVAGGVGLLLVVMGAVTLLRGGVDTMTSPTATVLGFAHTPLMSIISIVFGALFLSAAASTLGVRSTLTFLGLLALGFGLVVAIEPGATTAWFGGGRNLGLFYIVMGAGCLLAGWASPTITRERTSTRSGHDELESDSRLG